MESQARVKWLIPVRLILFAIGIVVWGYGYRADESRIRLAGIIVLVVALLLRFVRARRDDANGVH